jgi:hypothetical protein
MNTIEVYHTRNILITFAFFCVYYFYVHNNIILPISVFSEEVLKNNSSGIKLEGIDQAGSNQSRIIDNEYLLVIDDNSTSFASLIEKNMATNYTSMEDFNISNFSAFNTIAVKLPSNTSKIGSANTTSLDKPITTDVIRTIFNIVKFEPTSINEIDITNSSQVCDIIVENPEVELCELNKVGFIN